MAKRVGVDLPVRPPRPGVGQGEVPRQQEMVVGGYKLGEGNRAGSFGSLLVGVHDRVGGDLQFVGAVGTGFNERTLDLGDGRAAPFGDAGEPVRGAAEAATRHLPLGSPRARRRGRCSSSGPRAAASGRRCSSACATTNPRPRSSASSEAQADLRARRRCAAGSRASSASGWPRLARLLRRPRPPSPGRAAGGRRVTLLRRPRFLEAGLERGGEVDDGGLSRPAAPRTPASARPPSAR